MSALIGCAFALLVLIVLAWSLSPKARDVGPNGEKLIPIEPWMQDCLMTREEFIEAVDQGCFIDYDGFAIVCTATHRPVPSLDGSHVIYPSDVLAALDHRHPDPPWIGEGWDYILWFNR